MPSVKTSNPNTAVADLLSAFATQVYPVNLLVANCAKNQDLLPVVGGIIDPEPGYTGIVITVSGPGDLHRLAYNIKRLCFLIDGSQGFVVENTSNPVSSFSYEWKQGEEWYGYRFSSFLEAPSASAFGVGSLWIAGRMYWSDGVRYIAAGVSDTRKLSNWHRSLKNAIKDKTTITICWVGDSTTEAFAGSNIVPYVAGVSNLAVRIDPAFQYVNHVNYGSNGESLNAYVNNATPVYNVGGNDCRFNQLPICHGYVISLGLNDARGVTPPGTAGIPDYRTTYGGAGMVAMANLIQSQLKQGIDIILAKNPNASIALRMPNSVGVGASVLANSVTAQQCTDTLRLAYRGDPDLGVPCVADSYPNVVVWDCQGTLFPETAFSTSTGYMLSAAPDMFHPVSSAYVAIFRSVMELFRPVDTNLVSDSGLAYVESAIASGGGISKGQSDPASVITQSGEYDAVLNCSISANGATFFDLALNTTAETAWAWGGATGTGRGSASAPGLAPGDVIVFTNGKVLPITTLQISGTGSQSNNGAYIRWYGSAGPDGRTFAQLSADTSLPVGLKGTVYRHKYAHSLKARYNEVAISGGDSMFRKSQAFKNAYRFQVTSVTYNSVPNNYTIAIRAIAGEVGAVSGNDAFTHVLSTSDVLCLSGVEGYAGSGEHDSYGIPLTNATFDQTTNASTQTSLITLSSLDARNITAKQGFILGNL